MSVGFIKYDDLLEDELKNPELKKYFEEEKNLFRLEVKFNELLQKIGCEGCRVEIIEDDIN